MQLSIVTAAACVVFGTIYGAVSAYFGGIVDTIMTRIVEILMIIPSMIYYTFNGSNGKQHKKL